VGSVLPYVVSPVLIGSTALIMILIRELHPKWRPSLTHALYDLLLFGFGIALVLILIILVIQGRAA
jgi:hypothetical protein